MNDSLRKLMRRIARGLPLAVPVIVAPFTMGFGCYPLGYECPTVAQQVVVEHDNDGELSAVECAAACGENTSCGSVDPTHVSCVRMVRDCPPAGRPPRDAPRAWASAIASDPVLVWLRDAALMEAASVSAFEELAWRLERFGAPARLVDAARTARDDEARHAAAMTKLLGRRAGPVRLRVETRRGALGTVRDLARENAVTGCVGEAWAALEAAAQARRARDADVRQALGVIAREEARHALLSADVDRWARARLSDEERAEVDASADAERRRLRAELASRPPLPALGRLGGADAVALFDVAA